MTRKYWMSDNGHGSYAVGVGDVTTAVVYTKDEHGAPAAKLLPADYDVRAEARRMKASWRMLEALRLCAEITPYGNVENARARDAARAAILFAEVPR